MINTNVSVSNSKLIMREEITDYKRFTLLHALNTLSYIIYTLCTLCIVYKVSILYTPYYSITHYTLFPYDDDVIMVMMMSLIW